MREHTYVERDESGSGVATGMVIAIVAILLVGVVALFLFFGGPGRFVGTTNPQNPPANTNINVQPPQSQPQPAPNINVQPPSNPPPAPNVNINPPSNPNPAPPSNPGGNVGPGSGAGNAAPNPAR